MKKLILLLGILLAFGKLIAQAAIYVSYGGTVVDSAGQPLPNGNQVRLGYFDDENFDIHAAALAGDWAGANSHWHEFASTTTYVGGFPPPVGHQGYFYQDANNELSGLSGFSGQPIYLWVFKTTTSQAPTSWNEVSEYGVFKNTPAQSTWFFPSDGGSTTIDSADTGVYAHRGLGAIFNYQVTIEGDPWEFTSLQLAPIPEPGTWAVVTGAGLLMFIIYRRRLGKS